MLSSPPISRSDSCRNFVEIPLDDYRQESPPKSPRTPSHLQLETVEVDPLIFSIYLSIFEWIAFVFSQIYTSLAAIYESIVDLTKTNPSTSPNSLSTK